MEEESIFEPEFRKLWQQLNHNQRRFAVAMLDSPSKKEAALSINLEPNTVYKWNGPIDAVVEILLERAGDSAYEILEGAVVKAAMVKVAGLDSSDERTRQASASETLDRVLGRSTQPMDVTSGGERIGGVSDKQHDRAISTLAAAIGSVLSVGDSGEQGAVGAAEHAAVVGASEPSG